MSLRDSRAARRSNVVATGQHSLAETGSPARLTIDQRAAAFRWRYPNNAAAWPWVVTEDKRKVLYAVWVIGNDYRNKSRYYGAYPPGLEARVLGLFPDVAPLVNSPLARHDEIRILHAFSGSLPAHPNYVRCDMGATVDAEIKCNVLDVGTVKGCAYAGAFDLAMADPPYSSSDAEKYGTPAVNRGLCTRALASVVRPGGHLAWLDTCWPIHAKELWLTVGRILVQRSTNHRARVLSIFERV